MSRPRATCSVCGRVRRLRATGTIAAHYRLTPQGYNLGVSCPGVDQPPKGKPMTEPAPETKPFVVLVEYSLPADADLAAIIGPLKAALHELPLSVAPEMVTASVGKDAERMIEARRGEPAG